MSLIKQAAEAVGALRGAAGCLERLGYPNTAEKLIVHADNLLAEIKNATAANPLPQVKPVAWLVHAKNGMVRACWTVEPTQDQLDVAAFDGDTVTPLFYSQQGEK